MEAKGNFLHVGISRPSFPFGLHRQVGTGVFEPIHVVPFPRATVGVQSWKILFSIPNGDHGMTNPLTFHEGHDPDWFNAQYNLRAGPRAGYIER